MAVAAAVTLVAMARRVRIRGVSMILTVNPRCRQKVA